MLEKWGKILLKSKNVLMAAGTTFFLLLLEVFVVMHIVEAGSDVCSIILSMYISKRPKVAWWTWKLKFSSLVHSSFLMRSRKAASIWLSCRYDQKQNFLLEWVSLEEIGLNPDKSHVQLGKNQIAQCLPTRYLVPTSYLSHPI